MKDKDESSFHEAAMESVLNGIDDLPIKEEKTDLLLEIENRLLNTDNKWTVLNKMIEGGFTTRFIRSMESMGEKDFVKNYLKLLEHFKPKLNRAELNSGIKRDTTINIQTMIINSEGKAEVIDISEMRGKDETNLSD